MRGVFADFTCACRSYLLDVRKVYAGIGYCLSGASVTCEVICMTSMLAFIRRW